MRQKSVRVKGIAREILIESGRILRCGKAVGARSPRAPRKGRGEQGCISALPSWRSPVPRANVHDSKVDCQGGPRPDEHGGRRRHRKAERKYECVNRDTAYRAGVLGWAETNMRSFPWRTTDDPYRVLIGEVLLQRTRGAQVVPVYEQFVARWPTPLKLARAREKTIAAAIRPLGLAKRAPRLKALGRALVAEGLVPVEPENLLRLPGVGPYVSHAVAVFAGRRDLPLVDWVIARVLRRYFGLANGKVPNADRGLWEVAARLAADGDARSLWMGTLDLAHAVCAPRPRCGVCPLKERCVFVVSEGDSTIQTP